MIFSTLNQHACFFIFLFFGAIIGFIYSILKIIFLPKNNKNLIKNILNCIFFTIFSLFFVIILNFFNFGKLSCTLIVSYFLSFFAIVKLNKNLVVFLQNKWYNVISKLFKRKVKCKANELKE